MGFSVRQTKGSGDEGIDLVLEKEGAKTVVQCKGHAKPIGVGAARDLYGVMMHFGAPSAVLACPAGFTEGVMQFVMGKPIELVSAKELIEMAETTQQPTREAIERDTINCDKKSKRSTWPFGCKRLEDGLEKLGKKYKCVIHSSESDLSDHFPEREYIISQIIGDSALENIIVKVCEEDIKIIAPYHFIKLNLYNYLDKEQNGFFFPEFEQVDEAIKEVKNILESRIKK